MTGLRTAPRAARLEALGRVGARRWPNFLGLALGANFLAASMTPSLMPRGWLFQGVVSGIVAAIGYGLGVLTSFLWRRLGAPEVEPVLKQVAWALLLVGGPAGVVVLTVLGAGWQRDLHALMRMAPPRGWWQTVALLLGLLLAVLLVLIGRGLRWTARRLAAFLDRWVSPSTARVLGGVLLALLLVGILDGVVIRALFAAGDETFRVSDRAVAQDVSQPTSRLRSGSPASLVAWETLGLQGREFVSSGPSERDLAAFSRGPVAPPIRVYAGLSSRARGRDRAALVVAELERTGAFDRAVLCVMTTTGTGWIDPAAASALEHLWGGDTALATMQYSYLPSWVSFLVDASRAATAGEVLFDAVYERWSQLPADDRPLLLVFGESLGADGSEAAFSGVADLRNRTDGVLWVGPPNFSRLWSSFTERRDPGTPQHLPIYDGGATVRFASRPGDLRRPAAPWYHPRVVYLQHASDPVVWWSPRLLLRRPDWLAEPAGRDVLPAVRWVPVVTFWQVTADLANAQAPPVGHGHRYGPLMADAWAAIAPPPGWTDADTERLRALVAAEVAAAEG